MQRNGKLPHATTAVQEMPTSLVHGADSLVHGADSLVHSTDSLVQGADSRVHGTDSLVQGADSLVHGADSPAHGADNLVQGAGSPARPNKQSLKIYRSEDALEQRLMGARLTIETLLGDPKLAEALSPSGYTMTRILQGQALYQQALALVKQHRSSLGDQLTAADSRVSAQEQVHARYKRHVAFARLALRDDRGAALKLDLSARKRSHAGWVLQADQFYTNALANEAIVAKLAGYSVTVDQLLEAQQQVAAVAAGIVTQQRYKDVAQEAKQARDTALQALDRWMVAFRAVARIALADQPQHLVQLGLTGR
jgi:hypothetical protein